ncbi:MAG: lipopolysaccharide kinase InaA family protein [Deltaproteobacteria bacterium]|nr:lipopolysaccharide kinase InaA family protein [Deltaproteobacteria bacterium]
MKIKISKAAETLGIEEMLALPDVFSGAGARIIKSSASSAIGVRKLGDVELLVKRFNYKGALHSLARRIAGSRAKSLFKRSEALFEKGLPVPEPLAYAEGSRVSYFVSRYVSAVNDLGNLSKERGLKTFPALAASLAKAVVAFHVAGAVHGDLKWTNILMLEGSGKKGFEFCFVDIDQTRLCRSFDRKGAAADLTAFVGYGMRMNEREWVEGEFLPAYERELSSKAGQGVDMGLVVKTASARYAAWKKRQKTARHGG